MGQFFQVYAKGLALNRYWFLASGKTRGKAGIQPSH
jgi:hypothetical protein